MADKKPGPVKPPIIDAKPRETGGADDARTRAQTPPSEKAKASAASASGSASGTSKPTGTAAPKTDTEKPKTDAQKPKSDSAPTDPSRPVAIGAGALAATGLGGAALGLALAYGLAAFGLWPAAQPNTDPTAAFESRIADLEAAFSDVSSAGTQLDSRLGGLDTRLQTLEADISALGEASPVGPSDIDALATRVDEIANALSAVSAGASGADATQIGTDIAALQSRVDTVEGNLNSLVPATDTMTSDLQSLKTRIADLEAALADQPEVAEITAERDRFARIPGTIAALEGRIAAGEPFATALASLEAVLPDLDIPEPLRAASTTGIASADAITSEFRALMPELLAARPHDPNAGILDTLMSQAQSAIALRPAGDIEGDTPDALLARAETALEAGDLERAHGALAALPEPMQRVAEPVVGKIAAALAAQSLLEAARNAGTGNGEAAQ